MADDPLDIDPDGEDVEMDLPDDTVEENPDGSVTVKIDESPRPADGEFFSNLAETLPDQVLDRIAVDLLDLIERDKESRAKRDEQYKMGIQRTGLGDDAPGGAEFQGASRVVHPMLTEVCVDFSSRAIKELWPANGPAKSKIVGDVTKDKVAKANRKADFMNWQLTVQCPEARAEVEQMLTQLPLGGGQYMKLRWQEDRNRPSFQFIAIDEIYLPFAASNFYAAQRKTHVQLLTQLEYDQRVRSGMYRDVDLVAPSQTPEQSKAATANDKIEGRDSDPYNQDGQRRVFEVYVVQSLGDGLDPEVSGEAPAPYVITVDETSRKTLAIYRNWDEDDPGREELQWIVEFPFVPWRGAYPIGMTQMIGGLSGAATGALRALLDAAHISNSQTMLKLKGAGSRGGQSLTISPTEILEVEGGLNNDDIRKLAMPLPYNAPSGTLMELLGFLVESGKGVVRTTLDTTVESQENVPVGTTLARIEQGMVVFNAIHSRLHNAMQVLLAILNRLNATYLDDKVTKRQAGSLVASRADFAGPMDVVPVSDPNIFSDAQRFAQTQAVAQRAQLKPELYNARKVEERILHTLKIPGADELLVPELTPKEENAVSENVKASLGRQIVAFPDQDHIAHLKTHIPFMQSPVFGSSKLIAPGFLPIMLNHIKEHVVLAYAQEVFATASDVTDDFSTLISKTKDKASKQAMDRLVAEASLDVVGVGEETFGQLSPVIEQAIALLQQVTPPPQGDPAVQVAAQDVAMRGKVAEQKNQIEAKKIEDKAQEREARLQETQMRETAETQRTQIEQQGEAERERERLAAEAALARLAETGDNERTDAEVSARLAANHEDNVTAITIAEMGKGSGTDPNPTP